MKDTKSEQKTSCFQKVTTKLNLVAHDATPPDWKNIGLVFIALFAGSTTLTFLFPFLPEMIMFLGFSEQEKGTYAGLVASAVFAGRVFSSVFWGWLADKKGRKIVLLLSIALNGIMCCIFGFSKNIIMAILLRFASGLVNGSVGTAKTVLYDVSDNTNQAFSMTMLSLAWGSGLVAGPTFGGILASPCSKWPDVFDENGIFCQYPYLLASLFPFTTCTLATILIFFKFDETYIVSRKRSKKGAAKSEDMVDILPAELESQKEVGAGMLHVRTAGSTEFCYGSSMHSLNPESEFAAYMAYEEAVKPHQPNTLNRRVLSEPFLANVGKQDDDTQLQIETSKNLSQSMYLHPASPELSNFMNNGELTKRNGGISSTKNIPEVVIVDNEMENHKMRNGSVKENLNKETHQPLLPTISFEIEEKWSEEREEKICCFAKLFSCCTCCENWTLCKLLRLRDVWATIMLYSVMSFVTIAIDDVFPVFASMSKDLGGLGFDTKEIGIAIGAATIPLLVIQVKLYPFLVSRYGIRKTFYLSAFICLVSSQTIPMVRLLNDKPALLWTLLMIVQVPFKIATNCCFAGTSLLINNSVTQDLAGQVNGLAMTTTAIGRSWAPLLVGSLFSWTVTHGLAIGPPFDTSLPFFVFGMVYAIAVVECLFINPHLDKQKK